MRIAIYDRWLHTLGGGERELGAFAEAVQHDHDVHIITHQPADLALLAERLNLHVAPDALRVVPFDPRYEAVAAASARYDLLVNMSHGDLFVPRSRHSLLRVFFPHAAATTADASALVLDEGWYQPEDDFAWTGNVARMTLERGARSRWSLGTPHLGLDLHGWRPAGAHPASVQISVNGVRLAQRVLPTDGAWTTWRVPLPAVVAQARRLALTIETTTFNPFAAGLANDNRDLGIAVKNVRVEEGRFAASTTMTPADPQHYAAMLRQQVLPAAQSYDVLLANSRFTQHWIERRWHLPSEVLYPPIDVAALVPTTKQPMILSVGRFFAGSHNKKHLAMIAAFRALHDQGLRGWEYHLVGGCDETMPEHRAYLDSVRAAAVGYPIVVHVNIPFEHLHALYGVASIFWHATGYQEDEEREPERFEHFGISTVEAMAARCVPIVIGKAGQTEIVDHERNGLLWHSLTDLERETLRVIEQPRLRDELAQAAHRRAQDFAPAPFERMTRQILARFDT